MNDNRIAFHHSLRGRMVLLVVMPMVVILSGVIAYMTTNSFSAVRGEAESALRLLVDQVAAEVERGNAHAVLAAKIMVFAQEEALFGRRTESSRFARRVLEEFPEFTGAYFAYEPNADGPDAENRADSDTGTVDASGRFIPYWHRDKADNDKLVVEPLLDMETSLYYDGVRRLYEQAGKPQIMVTEPYVYEGKMIVEQSYPILREGDFAGIGGVDRALNDIEQFLNEIRRRDGVELFLISSRGRLIASTVGEGELKTKEIAETPYRELFGRFYTERSERGFELAADPNDGIRYYFASAPVPTGEWLVILREAEQDVLGPIRADLVMTTSVALAGLLAVVGLVWWFASALTRRIGNAAWAAKRLASGDLSHAYTQEDRSPDEIGGMFRAFNTVFDSYRQVNRVCEAIAEGDFSQRLERRSDRDTLADAINLMSERRREAEEALNRQSREAEARAGMEAELSDLNSKLLGELNVERVADKGLSAIVAFMGAPVAALFVAQEGGRLRRVTSHAYPPGTPKFFEPGVGSVGEVARQRRPLIQAPGETTARILFGFADTVPEAVVTYPLLVGEFLAGVVELGLFRPLDERQQDLVGQGLRDHCRKHPFSSSKRGERARPTGAPDRQRTEPAHPGFGRRGDFRSGCRGTGYVFQPVRQRHAWLRSE